MNPPDTCMAWPKTHIETGLLWLLASMAWSFPSVRTVGILGTARHGLSDSYLHVHMYLFLSAHVTFSVLFLSSSVHSISSFCRRSLSNNSLISHPSISRELLGSLQHRLQDRLLFYFYVSLLCWTCGTGLPGEVSQWPSILWPTMGP